MPETLEIAREGRVLRLAMNRPERRNALNAALCRALNAALETADSDGETGAILLSGNGKAFCAGMDLDETSNLGELHEALFTAGARVTKPIVAAVQGAALGGGVGLVANAHVVVAADEAIFGLTEIRLGLWPFLIFRSMTLALGERRATELSLTGRTFSAREAWHFGLVHHVVPTADLAARAREIAAGLAAASPTAIRSGLAFVQQVRGRDWPEAGRIANNVREKLFHSPDFAEGVRAFREKRPPRWPSLGK